MDDVPRRRKQHQFGSCKAEKVKEGNNNVKRAKIVVKPLDSKSPVHCCFCLQWAKLYNGQWIG